MMHNHKLQNVRRIELQQKLTKLLETQNKNNEDHQKLFDQEAELRWRALLEQRYAEIMSCLHNGIDMVNDCAERIQNNYRNYFPQPNIQEIIQHEVEIKRQLSLIKWSQNRLQNQLQLLTEKTSNEHLINPIEHELIEQQKQQLHKMIKNGLVFLRKLLCIQGDVLASNINHSLFDQCKIRAIFTLLNEITSILNELTQESLSLFV